MIVSNCPRCEEAFQVPDAAIPDDAYAQCPWCQETFPIAEVIGRLPPLLQVMSADGQVLRFSQQPAAVSHGHSTEQASRHPLDSKAMALIAGLGTVDGPLIDANADTVANETVTEENWNSDSVVLDGSSPQVQTGSGAQEPWASGSSTREQKAAPMSVTPTPQLTRRPRGKSGLRTFLSIVLGGLFSVPLALFILWLLTLFGVDIDLGFWPFDPQRQSFKDATSMMAGGPSLDRFSTTRPSGYDFSSGREASSPMESRRGAAESPMGPARWHDAAAIGIG
ncbi:MAG: zinc-ribbon domain-containing protein, partial [Pirellulales bacterium]|nr:zinc-ribbon domain-containing protein [Pirellulales bacterium]